MKPEPSVEEAAARLVELRAQLQAQALQLAAARRLEELRALCELTAHLQRGRLTDPKSTGK